MGDGGWEGDGTKGLTSSISDGLRGVGASQFPVPRPSELGEGRLSCEFWNDEERPGGPKVLASRFKKKAAHRSDRAAVLH
jgi:hypothetical protein